MVCVTSNGADQPAHTCSLLSICKSLEYSSIVKLLTERHLEFLSLNEGCTGSYDLSKCHIVENHMSRLNLFLYFVPLSLSFGSIVRFIWSEPKSTFLPRWL